MSILDRPNLFIGYTNPDAAEQKVKAYLDDIQRHGCEGSALNIIDRCKDAHTLDLKLCRLIESASRSRRSHFNTRRFF
jgi:hypothetical protein